MIKKTTIASFRDGDYQGVYDWTGGIPLTVDEVISVVVNQNKMTYRLIDKTTRLEDDGADQNVETKYYFELVNQS